VNLNDLLTENKRRRVRTTKSFGFFFLTAHLAMFLRCLPDKALKNRTEAAQRSQPAAFKKNEIIYEGIILYFCIPYFSPLSSLFISEATVTSSVSTAWRLGCYPLS